MKTRCVGYGFASIILMSLTAVAYADVSDFAATFRNNTGDALLLRSEHDVSLTLPVPVGQTITVPKSGWTAAGDKHVFIKVMSGTKVLCTADHKYGTKFDIGNGWDVNGDACPVAGLVPPPPPPPVVGAPVFSNMPTLIEVITGNSVTAAGSVSNTDGSTAGIDVSFSPTSGGGISASYSNGTVTFSGAAGAVGSYRINTTAVNNGGTSTFATTVQVIPATVATTVPRTISAWLYDASGGNTQPGQFVSNIKRWNELATNPGNKLIELHTYGTDMEMYGEAPNFSLETYYTLPSSVKLNGGVNKSLLVGPYNLLFYQQAIPELAHMTPIVDGRTDGEYLAHFNGMSLRGAVEYADLLSSQACMDERLDGLQIDVEPLDFVTTNGQSQIPNQVAFYLRIADNFSSIARDPMVPSRIGEIERETLKMCNTKHRFLSVFTFASKIQSAILNSNTAAAEATLELLKRDNFLVVDSLYDLPPGTTSPQMTDPLVYFNYVKEEVRAMVDLANHHKFNFKFAIPASCSFHECGTSSGGAHTQVEYAVAAINAIGAINAEDPQKICNSPYFKGVAVWAFDVHDATWDGQVFNIRPPSEAVMKALLESGTISIKGQTMKKGISEAIGCNINQ
ncbi:MAG: Ig-like domain-containing protein [Coxiellaceae bacterium]|nr:Ig-like domain-containing protein [Coxiellaceae bacterium]